MFVFSVHLQIFEIINQHLDGRTYNFNIHYVQNCILINNNDHSHPITLIACLPDKLNHNCKMSFSVNFIGYFNLFKANLLQLNGNNILIGSFHWRTLMPH